MTSAAKITVTVLSIALILMVYLPISVYYTRKLIKYRRSTVIQKRYFDITCYIIGFAFLHVCFDRVFELLYVSGIADWAFYIIAISYTFTAYGVIYCYVWRSWLMCYDLNWAHAALESEWHHLINPKHNVNNWWIQYRSKYGNPFYVRQRILIIFVIAIVIDYLVFILSYPGINYYPGSVASVIDLVLYTIPLCALIYIRKLIPDFEDFFFVKSEILGFLTIFTIFVIMNYLFHILSFVIEDETVIFAFRVSEIHLICLANVVCILIMTKYALDKTKAYLTTKSVLKTVELHPTLTSQNSGVKISMTSLRKDKSNNTSLNSVNTVSSTSSLQTHSQPISRLTSIADTDYMMAQLETKNTKAELDKIQSEQELTLEQVLSNSNTLDIFYVHAHREFNVEALLGLIEFTQFLEVLLTKFGEVLGADLAQLYKKNLIVFAMDVPRSAIVFDPVVRISKNKDKVAQKRDLTISNVVKTSKRVWRTPSMVEWENQPLRVVADQITEEDCKHIIYNLACKYVIRDSEFELNISSRLRNHYNKLVMDNAAVLVVVAGASVNQYASAGHRKRKSLGHALKRNRPSKERNDNKTPDDDTPSHDLGEAEIMKKQISASVETPVPRQSIALTPSKLIRLVKDTTEEIYHLLADSFGRFKGTPTYLEIVKNSSKYF